VPPSPPEEDRDARRPWWALSVLTMLTVLAVTVTIFLLDTAPRRPQTIDISVPTPSATSIPTAHPRVKPSATRHATRTPARHPSTSATAPTRVAAPVAPPPTVVRPPTPPRAAGPCGAAAKCVVPGDGGLAAAIDAARAQRGAAPVTVVVSGDAQQCALALGCSGQYALQAEPAQNGAAAVRDLGADPGSGWLLAPGTSAIGVGWAYIATYGYVAVLLRAG
jgi:hypothetical protein